MTRPLWPEYFLRIAQAVSTRATCDRKAVGAVLVDADHRIVATGFNGAPAGMPHCDDVGHQLMEINGRQSCIRTIHAESNALDRATRSAKGGQLFVTVIPCYDCAKRIVNAGVKAVYYEDYYESRNTEIVTAFFREAGVMLQSGCYHKERNEKQEECIWCRKKSSQGVICSVACKARVLTKLAR